MRINRLIFACLVFFYLSLITAFIAPSKVTAAQCSLDTYSSSDGSVNTYCSLSCGGNEIVEGYTGCGFGQYCCAETSKSCEGNCAYGRRTYCSINGGGNAVAPSDYQDCGLGRTCYVGSPDRNCPSQTPPSGTSLCGISPDTETGTETFCSTVCGYGSQESGNNTSSCPTVGSRCCRVSDDRCGDCQAGRRETCLVSDPSSGYPVVAKSCPLGSSCYLTDFDATCPAPPPQGTVEYCNVTPYEYGGRQLQTYCGVGCGGNLQINYPGCNIGKVCCVSNENHRQTPPMSFFEESENLSPYEICNQLSDVDGNRTTCQTCYDNKGIWTAVGCIETDATTMITKILRIAMGIAGGIALIMILAAGFMLSVSQGDPKRVSEARELITSAIIGLLFIIFSVTILQFIGVTLFRIPGLGG